MVILFTVAVFLAAALLFGVQPMVAKALLPDFGGGSSVWTTCMLFFQMLLIAGYLYAHLLLTRVPRKWQMALHGCVLVTALVVGWVFSEPVPPPGASEFPVPWLIGQLFLISGLPYFAISSAGPLLQGWFARTGHARAHDPYFLYAASNAGSFVGLLAYPFVIEPSLGLDDQRVVWLSMFGAFAVLALVCVGRTRQAVADAMSVRDTGPDTERITWKRRLWWMFLAFVPSTMLLGVTTHMTTDVASFPLLWVVPLALYLLTMIAAFSGRAEGIVRTMARPMVISIIGSLVLLVAWRGVERTAPIWGLVLVQLAVLITVGLYGHARLALDRPSARHLTEFYLIMSIGGAMGGLLNGIVGPLLLTDAYEYHIGLFCAFLMLPGVSRQAGVSVPAFWLKRLALPAGSLVAVLATMRLSREVSDAGIQLLILLVPPSLLIYMGWRDRVACAGALLFPLLGVVVTSLVDPSMILRERTFYGVHKVQQQFFAGRSTHWIIHGTTMHGMQFYGDPELSQRPLGYYHPEGPCGSILKVLHQSKPDPVRICVMGLGSGAMVTHGRPGDEMVFMEIDPAVARIAKDPSLFTYLSDAKCQVDVRLGDGRLLLERSEAAGEPLFDIIHADAFSSDSIPTHLLTAEALDLYLKRTTPEGMVVYHISNRHLDLFPLLHELAQGKANVLLIDDNVTDEEMQQQARFSSRWVVMTRSATTAKALIDLGYAQYEPDWKVKPWTDQYSNLLSVIDRR